MEKEEQLSPNCLAFIALTNEYCCLLEEAINYERSMLVEKLAKLLSRIYVSALDLEPSMMVLGSEIASSLEEARYDEVRSVLAQAFGEDDVYLEVFMDDMKYSDTPIATTISENLADLYQEFYEMLRSIEDLTSDNQREILSLCRDNFDSYWSVTLCNVLRAINMLRNNYSD